MWGERGLLVWSHGLFDCFASDVGHPAASKVIPKAVIRSRRERSTLVETGPSAFGRSGGVRGRSFKTR